MTVWRLHTGTSNNTSRPVADLCLKEKILAVGWSINDDHINERIKRKKLTLSEADEIRKLRSSVKTISEYHDILKKYPIYGYQYPDANIARLNEDLQTDDLVWLHYNGLYYIARIPASSKCFYNNTDIALGMDAAIQRTDIDWKLVGDEASVAGAIATSFIRGHTLQRISKDGALPFSQLIYNNVCQINYYKKVIIPNTVDVFYSMLSVDDCEDLVYSYLYSKYGYVVVPSSNKKGTQLYEYVMLDPKTGKHSYVQVKNGKVNIDAQEYVHLNGEVYLFTSKGKITNLNPSYLNIKVLDPQELFDFAKSDAAQHILSGSISSWINFIKGNGINK